MTVQTPQRLRQQDSEALGTIPVSEQRDDDIFDGIVDDFGEGGGNPRCSWDDSVCLASVTHRIVWGGFGDDGDSEPAAQMFCARHYGVSLARFAEFHEDACTVGLAQHLLNFGKLAG